MDCPACSSEISLETDELRKAREKLAEAEDTLKRSLSETVKIKLR